MYIDLAFVMFIYGPRINSSRLHVARGVILETIALLNTYID